MQHVQVTQQHLRPRRGDDGALMVTRSWRPSPETGLLPEEVAVTDFTYGSHRR